MLGRGEKQFQQTSLKERLYDAGERGKQAVQANKPQREGIGCLREGKVSSSNKQASERGELILEREESKHAVSANKPLRGEI